MAAGGCRLAAVASPGRGENDQATLRQEVARRTQELRLSEERRIEMRDYVMLVTRAIEEERKRHAHDHHAYDERAGAGERRAKAGEPLSGSSATARAKPRIMHTKSHRRAQLIASLLA